MLDIKLGSFPSIQHAAAYTLEMNINGTVQSESISAMDNYSAERKAYQILQATGSPAAVFKKGELVKARYAPGYTEQ